MLVPPFLDVVVLVQNSATNSRVKQGKLSIEAHLISVFSPSGVASV